MVVRGRLAAIAALAALASVTPADGAQQRQASGAPQKGEGIEPQADRMLRQMTDYLAGLRSFQVEAAAIDEVVTTDGQKVQLATGSRVVVQRPNRLHSEQVGALKGLSYWYDGKTMTLYCKSTNSYATAPAPPTLDETIDETRKRYEIDAPGADLIFSQPYGILTEQVHVGRFIGREVVDGVVTNHLAFQGEKVDWQIWIQEGAQPLPLRFVIATKTMKEQPEFVVMLSHWQTNTKPADSEFEFRPASGAKRVDSFPTSCQPSD